MKLSISTNWCNRTLVRGEEIAELALSLGFTELELGYRTAEESVAGFKALAKRIPIGSVHAFAPVPISAPQGYPELYSLADFDAGARDLARVHVRRNLAFAAEMGADALVLHAGRVRLDGLFTNMDTSVLDAILGACGGDVRARPYLRALSIARRARERRGAKLLDLFKRELDAVLPAAVEAGVTLAIENMPYYEGFPNDAELAELLRTFAGSPLKGWFDTGHRRVCECHAWVERGSLPVAENYAGMHLNDVRDFHDDHLAPGFGKVDFAALRPFAEKVGHVVFEPSSDVDERSLRNAVAHIRALWGLE